MAFIPAIGGALAGAGIFGNMALAAISMGINVAIAYFFPQKVKGPRAESLKAQTSKFGDHLARIYATYRAAGAVIWLKGDKVDEHVKKYRAGKALGPEVTEYSYTATFAVAFAWNGPVAAIPRIWADDKLIYDASAEALQDAIDHGGKATGVAKGASVTIYHGTQTQEPDPLIEADRGAGNVPTWPGIAYVVIKNLPLDEFGIRVPNIEAEIVHVGVETTLSVSPGGPSVGDTQNDTNGDYFASVWTGNQMKIARLPAAETIFDGATSFSGAGVHITDRNEVLVSDRDASSIHVFDAATGALKQVVNGVLPNSTNFRTLMDDITVAGITYVLVWRQGSRLSLLANDGSGYTRLWTVTTTFNPATSVQTLSVGPEYGYAVRNGTSQVVRLGWTLGEAAELAVTIPGAGTVVAAHYDMESDSVIVADSSGNIFVLTPDLSVVLRSKTATGIALSGNCDQLLSRRMKSGSDRIVIKDDTTNDVSEFRVSDLSLVRKVVASTTNWNNRGNSAYDYAGTNSIWGVVLTVGSAGVAPNRLWYLPRASRGSEALADIIANECRIAGVTPDVSKITTEVKGYGIRDGAPPRGVIEDLQRINFFDWAQVDGVLSFFPRKTTSTRTLTLDEIGVALNAEPDPIQITEEYPAALDVPEQVIISYPSWDAEYRTGSQAGNAEEDEKFPDEPWLADETGYPLKVRRKRPIEFSTAQVLTDQDAARVADLLHNELRDAATVYKTSVGPKHLDLHPGEVVELPLDGTRTAKAVITKITGDTLLEMEFRKRGDSYVSEAVGQPTPYVIDSLLGIADVQAVLIDGHLLRADDDNAGFYSGIAVTSRGQFRSASIYRSSDGGSNYLPWAAYLNGTIRGIATSGLPDRPSPWAWDRASSFTIAVPQGTPPDSVTEDELLATEALNGFAVWNGTVADWEYIRAASVVDNLNGSWTLSKLLRGRKGTEFAMAGHAIGDIVIHLDAQAMSRATEGDRTLSRIYVPVATGTAFDPVNAVTFTNMGKGLRPWAPVDLRVTRDGLSNISGAFRRRDRLGQEWPESGPENPPMSETSESYKVRVYGGGGAVLRTITTSSEAFTYSAVDQTTDFGAPQASITFGIVQVSATYGDGMELRTDA